MGLVFQSDKLELRDAAKQLKFSTTRKMPHLLYEVKGSYTVPLVKDGNSLINRYDEKIILTNSNINTDDPFTIAFFNIVGGPADTGGKVSTGGGSIILRILRRVRTGEFLGSSILDVTVQQGQLKLRVSQNLDIRQYGGGSFGSPAISAIRPQDILGDDAVSIDYSVFYGRFR